MNVLALPPPAADFKAAWPRVVERLRTQPKITEAVYSSWFARLEADGIQGGAAFLTVPTAFLRTWLRSQYGDLILRCVKAECECVERIEISVRQAGIGRNMLSVALQLPDEGERRQILQRLVDGDHNDRHAIASDVLDVIARLVRGNVRDLQGALNRLAAMALLTGLPPTVESAERAIADLIGTQRRTPVKIEDIQNIVAARFNLRRADLLSQRRTANITRPRQIAMYIAKIMTLRSMPEIGRRFAGRDHTTVLYAVRKVEALMLHDAGIAGDVSIIIEMLGGAPP